MAEIEITKKQIIVVDEVGENSYGDLTFTDKDGNEYKVGAKRRQYFSDVIFPGVTVQLNYSKFKGKEYIYNANLVKDADKPPPQSKASPIKEEGSGKLPIVEHKSSPETGMWWGQMGDMLRSGDIDKNTPQGKVVRNAYYAEMFRVLGINIKEVLSAKSLIEEAKKLSAKEIRKEGNN